MNHVMWGKIAKKIKNYEDEGEAPLATRHAEMASMFQGFRALRCRNPASDRPLKAFGHFSGGGKRGGGGRG